MVNGRICRFSISSSLSSNVSEILCNFIITCNFFIEREPIYNVSLRRFARALQLKLFTSIHFFVVINGKKGQMKSCLCERNFKNTCTCVLLLCSNNYANYRCKFYIYIYLYIFEKRLCLQRVQRKYFSNIFLLSK